MTGKKEAQDVPKSKGKLTKAKAKVDKPIGRPTKYSPALAEEICDTVASHPNGLAKLCSEREHWPAPANIFVWLRKYPEFREQYARAKVAQVDASINLMQEMMDEPHKYFDEFGNVRIDVSMLRVKYDAIKWQASKLQPKQYGEQAKDEGKTDTILQESLDHKHRLDEKNKKDF